MCQCKMNEYLSETCSRLKSNNYSTLNIIIGNESCDLDSAACSIIYAAFLNFKHEKFSNENDKTIFVPMLDVDRCDFALKTEVKLCLNQYGIMEDNLIFRDDIDLEKLVANESKEVHIILVDHHTMSKRLQFLEDYVKEIIDHRPEDRTRWNYKYNVRIVIMTVGSCCTLVCQKIRDNGLNGCEFFTSYPVCAEILYDTIILDTVNFSKEVNKAMPLDEDNAQYLENIIQLENVERERQTRLDRLLEARSDITSLTPAQLLRKDLKVLGDLLVPSIHILIKEFLKKPQALAAVKETLMSRDCNVALLLGMDLKDGLKRDAAIISPDSPERAKELAKFLQEWSSPSLQLVSESNICLYFNQMNVSASRKQYMPALNEFLLNKK